MLQQLVMQDLFRSHDCRFEGPKGVVEIERYCGDTGQTHGGEREKAELRGIRRIYHLRSYRLEAVSTARSLQAEREWQ